MLNRALPRKNDEIQLQNRNRETGFNDNKLYVKDYEDKYRLGSTIDNEAKEYILLRSSKKANGYHGVNSKSSKNSTNGERQSNFGNQVSNKENLVEIISDADVIKKRGGKAAYMIQKQEEENKHIDDLLQMSQTKSILIPPKEPIDEVNKNDKDKQIIRNDNNYSTISEISMNVIKSSYIQNINVIEKLYNEKISMENRIKLLEDILQRNKNTKDHNGVYVRSIVDEVYNNNNNNLNDESLEAYFNSQDNTTNYTKSDGGLTAKDAALQLFAIKSTSDNLSMDAGESKVNNAPKNSDNNVAVKNVPKMNTSKSLSANLLADQDKYLMKRRLLDEFERKKKLEDELNEKERIKKQKYMALHGKEFTNVIKRQDEAQKKRKEKLDEIMKQKELQEKAEAKLRREKLKNSQNSQVYALESWAEMEEKQNIFRRQRADARKQELLSLMREPACASAPAKKYKTPATTVVKVRESPDEVIERLTQEHEAWKVKIETARTKAKKKVLLSHASYDGTSAMEQREKILKSRRDARIKRQQLESQKKELQKKKEALLASEKLFSQPVPPASRRLTRSAEVRSQSIRNKLGNSPRIDNTLERRDQDTPKSKSGSMSDEIIKTRVEIAQNSYKQNLLANKKRIHESLQARPTLIDRHNATTAILDGKQNALAILDDLVKTTMNRNKVNKTTYYSDDEEQNMKRSNNDDDYRMSKHSNDYDECKSNRK
jgi:hypothetical protein